MSGLSKHVIFILAVVIKIDPSSIDVRAGSIPDCDIILNLGCDSLKTVFSETAMFLARKVSVTIVFIDDEHNTWNTRYWSKVATMRAIGNMQLYNRMRTTTYR